MDIDGVLVQGPHVIPGAQEAVRMLREEGVPYAFMTNGGGVTEMKKAKELAEILHDPGLTEERLLLSHTPMRSLAEKYRGRRVMVVGGKETVAVARGYGFDFDSRMAVTPLQIAAGTPGIHVPSVYARDGLPPFDVNSDGIPIEAVLIFFCPADFALDLQLVIDALSGGRPLGSGFGGAGVAGTQCADLVASNPDFLWQASYPVPRFGQGAFLECLRALWRQRSNGHPLRMTEFGKPHRVQFEAVLQMLMRAEGSTVPPKKLYMVGDNPAADIRGANQAQPGLWRSILVCTGVYQGGLAGNDPQDPAWRVERDLRSAVERLLQTPDKEHLVS